MQPRIGWLLLAATALVATGCAATEHRAWQHRELPTHDRQRAFQAARDVLARHFDVADANIVQGTIETHPHIVDRPREGTMADWRGAGGRWRAAAQCQIGREGLNIVASVLVPLQREATAAAMAIAGTGRDDLEGEIPESQPSLVGPVAGADEEVWTEAGYDETMARELLAEIVREIQIVQRDEAVPLGASPEEVMEESKRLGDRMQE
jgi:hypothetical protein